MMIIALEPTPKTRSSKKIIKFQCDCGNIFTTVWMNHALGKSQSCGHCKIFKFKQSGQRQFNYLTLTTEHKDIKNLTDKVAFVCVCGNKREAKLVAVINGNTQSCGCKKKEAISAAVRKGTKYVIRSKSEWLALIPILIDEDLPDMWAERTSQKMSFRCKCGNIFVRRFGKCFQHIKVATCKRCHIINIERGRIVGIFIYDDDRTQLSTNSDSKYYWICKCGKRALIEARNVFNGYKKMCGMCNLLTVDDLAGKKFGKLTMVTPESLKIFSGKKVLWKCDCGNEKLIGFHSVYSGQSGSCGKCKHAINEWYAKNQDQIRSAKFPVKMDDPLWQPFHLLEDIQNYTKKFRALCPICKKERATSFAYMRRGESLSCGCTSSTMVSRAQVEISSFILSLGFETQFEFAVNDLKYDIHVVGTKLLIEYHGLKWHSSGNAKERDMRKYENAIHNGYKQIVIFEDEWKLKKDQMKEIISHYLCSKTHNPITITTIIPLEEANEFHTNYNHAGPVSAPHNYGVFRDGELIAVTSFSPSGVTYELTRLTYRSGFQSNIILETIKSFIEDYNPKSLHCVSDNRLDSDDVYINLGFVLEKELEPEYYLTNNKHRFSNPDSSTKYGKIWNLGTKRWMMTT